MFKKLSEWLKVDDDAFEIDEKEFEMIDRELNGFQNDVNKVINNSSSNKVNGSQNSTNSSLKNKNSSHKDNIYNIAKVDLDLVNDSFISNTSEMSIKSSFDFEREIINDNNYNKPIIPDSKDDYEIDVKPLVQKEVNVEVPKKIPTPARKVVDNSIIKDSRTIISKEDYVLRDIISPIYGVVRKEEKTIQKEEKSHEVSKIIKLRDKNKVVEIEYEDEFNNDTKKMSLDALNKISEKRKTLSETSKFTLVEDSTGEMRLFIDEEE